MYLKAAQENLCKVKKRHVSDTSCWHHQQLAHCHYLGFVTIVWKSEGWVSWALCWNLDEDILRMVLLFCLL